MSKTWYSDLPKYYQRQIAAMGLTRPAWRGAA